MIYTITLNPSLDYVLQVGELKNGMVNRCDNGKYYAGGKGINVSLMLKNLGIESVATGFNGGFTGKKLTEMLDVLSGDLCRTEFIEAGETRINVKLNGEECTEINCNGCEIGAEQADELFCKLESSIKSGDFVVMAGSIPRSVSKNIYEKICGICLKNNACSVVDTSGEPLRRVLSYKPFLIKPNHHELGELFGVEVKTAEKAAELARILQSEGAKNVLVSMGGGGAVLIAQDGKAYFGKSPSGTVLNTVGCGDSMVAGFLRGICDGGDYAYALKSGLAAGSATAFSEWLGSGEEYRRLMAVIEIKEVEKI